MSNFNYQAADKNGKTVAGQLEAGSLDEAVALLHNQQLFPIEMKEVGAARKMPKSETPAPKQKKQEKIPPALFKKKISHKIISAFTRELATLLQAGIPLLEALRDLENQTKEPCFKSILACFVSEVEGGAKFSDAIARYPKSFGELFESMIRSAEATGSFELVLNRLADYSERLQKLKERLKSALMYPMFVIIVAIAVLTVLMIYVVPSFMEVFEEFNTQLPLPTLILINANVIFRRWWFVMLGLGLFGFLSLKNLSVSPAVKKRIDRLKINLPLFGPLIRKAVIARVTQTLSTLIANGVTILDALEITGKTAENEVFKEAFKNAIEAVREGEDIIGPLQDSGVFPELVIDMIRIGEESATLDVMLERVAKDYEGKVETAISGLTSILEPALIVLLGLVIGFIVFAVFSPLMVLIKGVY